MQQPPLNPTANSPNALPPVLSLYEQTAEVLRLQAEREKLVGAIAQWIGQTLDLHEILQQTLQALRQVLQVDRTLVYQFETLQRGKVTVEAVNAGIASILDREIEDAGLETCLPAYLGHYVHIIEDLETANLPDCYVDLLKSLQVRANLAVPILQQNQLWGLLVVQHCGAPRLWQVLEVDLMRQLATHLSIAIQQTHLYQQLQDANHDLERQVQQRMVEYQQALRFEAVLKRITDRVRDTLDEAKIFETALQDLTLELGALCCETAFYDLDQQMTTICYEYIVDPTITPSVMGHSFPLQAYPEVSACLLGGTQIQFCRIFPLPASERQSEGQFTILACPLLHNQDVFGDIWLFKACEHYFSELEIRLAQQVANQCAIALRQARLYQAVQAQVQELQQLNHLKDDFISTVSHELRTPMSNINMAIRMLEIAMQREGIVYPAGSQIDRYLRVLRQECQREVSLINDLLDLQRLDNSREQIVLETIDLSSWLSQLVMPFADRLQKQQLTLQLELPPNLAPFQSDVAKLERILSELLNNACKYTPPQHSIILTVVEEASYLCFRVTNFGVDIPLSEQDKIFNKFYRVPNADPWRHGGTGLGLALVKKLVEYLGGLIQLESGQGQTAFTVMLPIA